MITIPEEWELAEPTVCSPVKELLDEDENLCQTESRLHCIIKSQSPNDRFFVVAFILPIVLLLANSYYVMLKIRTASDWFFTCEQSMDSTTTLTL